MMEVEVEMGDDNMIRRSHGFRASYNLVSEMMEGCSLSTEYIFYPR